MSLEVISCETTGRNATVIIAGDGQEEVMSPAAKEMAISAAASKGISRAGISGNPVAYPVDDKGETDEELILGRRGAATGYRCDYAITGGI